MKPAQASSPQRTCIACRHTDDQSALRRLTLRDGVVVDGTAPRLAGRGAYVHPGCVELALRRRSIQRAFPGARVDETAPGADSASSGFAREDVAR